MTFKIVSDDRPDFYDRETWIEARQITREQVENSLVLRWIDAHQHILSFRRNAEQDAEARKDDAHRFWYGTKNRIVLVLAIVGAHLHGEAPSRSELARRTGMSVQTVINCLNDAQHLGFVDDNDLPDERTRKLVRQRVLDMVDDLTFERFAVALQFYRQAARNNLDPHVV